MKLRQIAAKFVQDLMTVAHLAKRRAVLVVGIFSVTLGFTIGPALAASLEAQRMIEPLWGAPDHGHMHAIIDNTLDRSRGVSYTHDAANDPVTRPPTYLGIRVEIRRDTGSICRFGDWYYNQGNVESVWMNVAFGGNCTDGNSYRTRTWARYYAGSGNYDEDNVQTGLLMMP